MSNSVFEFLKQKAKEQGQTYKDLANALDLSEASIKRIFSNGSCHMDQFHEICHHLNVHPSEVYGERRETAPTLIITKQLEDYFLANPQVFLFYRQLTFSKNIKALKSRHQLTQKTIKSYLNKLKELGLIEVGQRDKIKFLYSKVMELPQNGALMKRIRKDWLPFFMEQVSDNGSKSNYLLETFTVSLSKESADRYKRRLQDLRDEMFEQGEKDKRHLKEDKGVSFVFAQGPGRMAVDGEIY